jgi:LysR family transcriptional regulator, nod-box dependent transcriptional activator
MRFNKLDLNLLVALDVLLVERNVSRSADRLHVTQSAVSNALARLRDYFDDEILVPVGRRMELTPRAELLKEAVRDILVRIESSVTAKPLFEPRTSDRRFRIFVSDYTMITLAPHVLALAGRQAKTVEFELLPQTNLAHRPLERGEADLLIIPSEYASSEHPTEALFDEDFVCVCWDQSAYAGGKLTRRKFLEASHVVMQPTNQALSYESAIMTRLGVERRIGVRTFSFAALPHLVVGTDRIATIHARLAMLAQKSLPIRLMRPPFDIPPMRQVMQWHSYLMKDPGMVWLRNLLREATTRMDKFDVAMAL